MSTTRHRILTRADVLSIPRALLPAVVLTDNRESWLSWRIRRHTHGSYNHACMMHEQGRLASQGWTLKNIPVTDYMRPSNRIKIWVALHWTPEERMRVSIAINQRLALPARKRRYDWLGVIGQLLRIQALQFKRRRFCSEDVRDYLAVVDEMKDKRPTPENLNVLFKTHEASADDRRYILGVLGDDLRINYASFARPCWAVYGVFDPDLDS